MLPPGVWVKLTKLRLAVRCRAAAINLIRKLSTAPLGRKGLAGLGVVASHSALALLLQASQCCLTAVQLLSVNLCSNHIVGRGLRIGRNEVAVRLLGVGNLHIELFDVLVRLLEEGLGTNAILGAVALDLHVALALRIAGRDPNAPDGYWSNDHNCDESADHQLHSARCPPLELSIPLLIEVGHVNTSFCEGTASGRH